MTTQTPRLGAPLLSANQAQKEIAHNEAIVLIDALLNPVVQDRDLATPPSAPQAAQIWIIGSNPVDDWTGRSGQLAIWTDGGWRYVDPFTGLRVWILDEDVELFWDGVSWLIWRQAEGQAIADPSGGATIDSEARTAVAAILALLRQTGLLAP